MKNNRLTAACEKLFGRYASFAFSLVVVLCVTCGMTLSYIVTKTPSVINIFKPILNEDLTIQKTVEHPFGDNYTIPDTLEFDFQVCLGETYTENMTVKTSQGDKTVDEDHCITLEVKPGNPVTIENILVGTKISVTELLDTSKTPGFSVKNDEATKTCTIQKGDNIVTFTNKYEPSAVNPVNLTVSGTKELEGREWQEGDTFAFKLEYKKEDGIWEEIAADTVTYELIASGDSENPEYIVKPDFEKFDFNDAIREFPFDHAGIYAFRVSEVAESIGGVTYDNCVSYFDVVVGDAAMDGVLEIQSVTGYQNAAAEQDGNGIFNVTVPFVNHYAPEGSAEAFIHIKKEVDDRSGQNKTPAGFTFELFDEEGKLVAESGETSAAGEAVMKLVYDAEDAGKSFVYTLKEKNAGQTIDGMTYDNKEYVLMVLVKDNGDGTMSAVVDEYDAGVIAAFEEDEDYTENVLPPAEENIPPAASEALPSESENLSTEGEVPSAEGEVPAEGEVTPTESEESDAEDEVQTTEEPSTEAESETIEETPVIVEEEVPITFVGTSLESEETNVYEASFVNVYDPQDTTVSISGDKDLSGREMKIGEFQFNLYETGDDFVIADIDNPKDTKTNSDTEGSFVFDDLNFDQTGNYYYVVTEDATAKLGGVSYDTTKYYITISVEDNAGYLSSNVKMMNGKDNIEVTEIKFDNAYHAKAVELIFTGKKVLKGGLLTNDMFKFKLYSADSSFNVTGAALQAVTNKIDGSISFEKLVLDEAGTYYYVVEEDDSNPLENTEYDDTRYGLAVVVEDPGNGQLTANMSITEIDVGQTDEILFENIYTYVEPEQPEEPDEPDDETDEPAKPEETEKPVQSEGTETGDMNHVGLMIILLVVSGIIWVSGVTLSIFFLKKRKA